MWGGGVARCERDATMTHQRSTGLTSIHSLFESIVYDDLYSSSDGVFFSPFHVTSTFLGGPTPKPLLPLYATVISSHPPPRPLVRHHRRLSSAIRRRRTPLVRSHQCHSTITLPHLSAGHCHPIIASHLVKL